MASLIHHITSTSHMHVQIQWLQLFLASDFGFYFIFEEIPCLLIKDLYIYLPVPSFSTAWTNASTSATEKGLRIRRCATSDRLDFRCMGTTVSASTVIAGTVTNALESVVLLWFDVSVGEGAESWSLSMKLPKESPWGSDNTLLLPGWSAEAFREYLKITAFNNSPQIKMMVITMIQWLFYFIFIFDFRQYPD